VHLPVQKLHGGRHSQIELECIQDGHLHLEHLVLGLGLVGDLDEVAGLGGLYLFLLAGDQQAGHPDQLKFGAVGVSLSQIPVDHVDGQLESFGQQLEFEVDLHQPVHENAPHLFVDVLLRTHLGLVTLELCLGLQTVCVDVFGLESAVQGVHGVPPVDPTQLGLEVNGIHH